jgi:hypothetical protein
MIIIQKSDILLHEMTKHDGLLLIRRTDDNLIASVILYENRKLIFLKNLNNTNP